MQDEPNHQWRSCESKVAHDRWSTASREANRLNALNGSTQWQAYLCGYCGWYHVGRHKTRCSEWKEAAARRKR